MTLGKFELAILFVSACANSFPEKPCNSQSFHYLEMKVGNYWIGGVTLFTLFSKRLGIDM